MTEAQWLACFLEPGLMIDQLARLGRVKGPRGQRRLRLFSCACCRESLLHHCDEQLCQAVNLLERHADGLATTEELAPLIHQVARAALGDEQLRFPVPFDPDSQARFRKSRLANVIHAAMSPEPVSGARQVFGLPWVQPLGGFVNPHKIACNLLRDIFGNPFHPLALDPAWRTAEAASLAQAAYEERLLPGGHLDSLSLAVLGDALEEAGCAEQTLLDHLRSPVPHVRGCWAVDSTLGWD